MIQDYTNTKFQNIRELYASLDCDKDGLVLLFVVSRSISFAI